MDSLDIRPATAADKEAVLSLPAGSIPRIDYLAGTYDIYLANPNALPFVGLINGEVVMFIIVISLDEECSQFALGGRVKAFYQGKGVFRRFEDGIVGGIYRGKKVENSAVAIVGEYLKYFSPDVIKKFNVKLSFTKSMSAFHLPNDAVVNLQPQKDNNRLQLIEDNQMKMYFNSEKIKCHLFPEGKFSVNRIVYQPLESNIPIMYQMGTEFFSDLSTTGTAVSGLVTCASSHCGSSPKSWLYRVDVWGNDTRSLKAHLSFHLNRCRTVRKQERYFITISNRGHIADEILKFARERNISVLKDVEKLDYFVNINQSCQYPKKIPFNIICQYRICVQVVFLKYNVGTVYLYK